MFAAIFGAVWIAMAVFLLGNRQALAEGEAFPWQELLWMMTLSGVFLWGGVFTLRSADDDN